MKVFISLTPPYHWARLDRKGEVKHSGIFTQLNEAKAFKRDELIGVVPGEDVPTHLVQIPTRSRKKLLAAAPFALENDLSEDAGNLVFQIVDWQPAKPTVIAIISKTTIETWRTLIHNNGLNVTDIIAEYQLLPLTKQTLGSISDTDHGNYCLRFADKTGASIDHFSLETWWDNVKNPPIAQTDKPSEKADTDNWVTSTPKIAQILELPLPVNPIGNNFVAWLSHSPNSQPIAGILNGILSNQSKTTSRFGIILAGLIFVLAGLIKLGFDGYELYHLQQERIQLDTEIRTLVQKTFSDIKKITNAPLQFSRKLDALEQNGMSGGDFHPLLLIATQALTSVNARLEEISFKSPNLIISCSVNNFATLDRLKQQLEKHTSINAQLISSGSLNNRVTGRFSLHREN